MKTTTMHMLPVCECGQLIPEFNIEISIENTPYGYNHLNFIFYPEQCPSCGKYIDGLQLDSKYIGLFHEGGV